MTRPPVVTVDGPAGSGKTTLGRRLALALALPLVDTGLFYRALMVAAVAEGMRSAEPERIADLARRIDIEINTDPADESWQVRLGGKDVTQLIRDPSHAPLLSAISQTPGVRAELLAPQRRWAEAGAVAVGRDCGTVVFPEAIVKLYLDASAGLRQSRRALQLQRQGAAIDTTTLNGEIAERDRIDAPALLPATDAIIIDTGRHGIEAMVEIALRHCAAVGLVPAGP